MYLSALPNGPSRPLRAAKQQTVQCVLVRAYGISVFKGRVLCRSVVASRFIPFKSVIALAHSYVAAITPHCTARPSAPSILSHASAPCKSSSNFKVAAQPRDVAVRRGTEQLFILTAKIRRVFITDAGTGACHVQSFAEHQAARFLKPDLFLKLQMDDRRDALEMVLKAENAHAELARCLIGLTSS